jgi:putative ABC transport system ATP-binding protein
MSVIKTDALKKTYLLGKVLVPALRGVDIDVAKGEFVALMGPSGAGKSTLLNMVGMLDSPTSGDIFIDGTNVSTLSENERVDFRLEKIGFIFQFFNLFMELSALENIILPSMLLGKDMDECRRCGRELLHLVGLDERENHLPSELSGGEQQRVTVARSLVNNPSFLLADEPTANLDTENASQIVTLFRRLNAELGITIFMVTHEEELGQKADRIIRLRDGVVLRSE